MNKVKKNGFLLLIGFLFLGLSACQKEKDYYLDSGMANPYFDGTVEDYLNAKPFYFDSVTAVIRLSGMEDIFTSDSLGGITFFAPTDRSLLRLINDVNEGLYALGYDTIRALQDVPDVVWKKYLSRYVFHGVNQLKDYPQIDYDLLANYPGQAYLSWGGAAMNIGVVYHDDNGVKYVGYRQLSIAYIPDVSDPMNNVTIGYVASCNILTNTGVVHVLNDEHVYFGFDEVEFLQDMEAVMRSGGKK